MNARTDRVLDDIRAVRERQLPQWSTEHDDQHATGELAIAASYLADPDNLDGGGCVDLDDPAEVAEAGWAVQLLVKHRADRRRQLVIAAALLVAEIERLDRGGDQ